MSRWVAALLVGNAALAGAQVSAVVSGTVIDSATRQPVSGAIVTLRRGDTLFSERSDEAGAFRLSRVSNGAVVAEVKRIGYEKRAISFELTRDTTLRIVMAQAARRLLPVKVIGKGEGIFGVIGRATDLKPITGAQVLVVGSGVTVTTDSAGEFFVPLKQPGSYLVRVTANGFGEEAVLVAVKRNEVAESSQLLDVSDRKPLSAGLWDDFDQRLRWRPVASALISGAEIRAAGSNLADGIKASPAFIRSAMRMGPVCLFVNGQPRPGTPLEAIRVEEVRAIEVYSDQRKDEVYLGMLKEMWPKGAPCGGTGALSSVSGPRSRSGPGSRPAPIATARWVVVWLR